MTPDQLSCDRERLSRNVLKWHHDRLTAEQAEDAESRRPPLDPMPRVAERHEMLEPRDYVLWTFVVMFLIGLCAAFLFGALVGHWAL